MSEMLDFKYDAEADILTVEGIKFSGGFFRALAGDMNLNTPMVISERKEGFVVVHELSLEELKEAVHAKETEV